MTEEAPESLSNMKTSADAEGSDAASEMPRTLQLPSPSPSRRRSPASTSRKLRDESAKYRTRAQRTDDLAARLHTAPQPPRGA